MPKTLSELIAKATTVQSETAPGANTALRIGLLFAEILLGQALPYDPQTAYQPGQSAIFWGRSFRCFQSTQPGESPETKPEKWEDSAAYLPDDFTDGSPKLARAVDVRDYVDTLIAQALTAPGALAMNVATDLIAGIALRATVAKITEGTDNGSFITPLGLSFALAEALRGINNYGWNDATAIDPTTNKEITVNNLANVLKLRLIESLEIVDRDKVEYILTQLPNGTIAKTFQGVTAALGIVSGYDEATDILTLSATNARGTVKYSIPALGIVDSAATTFPVPPEFRSGNAELKVTAKTPTQTAETTVSIPADPLGVQYITAVFVARNIGAIDGVNSLSFYVKGEAAPGNMRIKLIGRNGTNVPFADWKVLTTEDGGYQRVGLFTGAAKYASLYSGISNGYYTVTVEVEAKPVSLTFNYSISDAQNQVILYQSLISPPEVAPTPPALGDLTLKVGVPVNLTLPPFVNATNATYSINRVVAGCSFNSSTRTLTGTPTTVQTFEAVQYICTMPTGANYLKTFDTYVVAADAVEVAKILAVDMQQLITGAGPQYSQTYTAKFNGEGGLERRFKFNNTFGAFSETFGNWGNFPTTNPPDANGYNHTLTLFNTGNYSVSIEIRPKLTPTDQATVKLTFPPNLNASPRTNYYSAIATGGGGGGQSATLTAYLGPEPILTGQQVIGFNGNPNRMVLSATVENGKVRLSNTVPFSSTTHFALYRVNSELVVNNLGSHPLLERGRPHLVMLHIIINNTPLSLWTNQNYQLEGPCESIITVY